MSSLFSGSARRRRAIRLLRGDSELLHEGFDDSAVSQAELQEFLAGDLLEDTADPQFKEDLRGRLWTIVQARYGPRYPQRD